MYARVASGNSTGLYAKLLVEISTDLHARVASENSTGFYAKLLVGISTDLHARVASGNFSSMTLVSGSPAIPKPVVKTT